MLLNKPIGYVSGQAEDGYEPAVVLVSPATTGARTARRMRFLRQQLRGLAPAGRLDIDSIGLLVLTQDGRVAQQLIGEDSEIEKEYLVRVGYGGAPSRPLARRRGIARLRHGLSLDGQALQAGAGRVAEPRAAALRAAARARSGRSAACARRSACRWSA